MNNFLQLSLILLLCVASCFAQEMRPPDFPKDSMEDRIVNYFKAFNSGDEGKMTEFINENSSADALKRRPVKEQIEFYKRLHDEMKNVKVTRFLRAGENEIKALVETENGETVSFDFRFEPQTPYKIEGMRIGKVLGTELVGEPPPTARFAPFTEKEFAVEIEKTLNNSQKLDDFSGAVLIAQKDKVIYTKAVGSANKEKNTPNLVDTKFNIGSLNKSFTQIAIGQLVEKGKLSYDDKLGSFLPDYPNKDAREKITVRHLLTMSSGVGDIFGEKFQATPKK